VYYLSAGSLADRPQYIETREHRVGLCPVVAFRNVPDLEGRAPGEVEPLMSVQDRINQTVFDTLVAQTFGSFKIRHVSGMAPQLDEHGQPRPLAVDQRRFLMATDPDTRFGQLDENRPPAAARLGGRRDAAPGGDLADPAAGPARPTRQPVRGSPGRGAGRADPQTRRM
jgi:hypothetical protein